jgi:antitoxin component of MazEF toxin-antitoxin module
MRLEADGTVRLPVEVCAAMGWQPGDELELAPAGDELRLRRTRPSAREVEDEGAGALVTPSVRRQLAEALAESGVGGAEAERAAAALAQG